MVILQICRCHVEEISRHLHYLVSCRMWQQSLEQTPSCPVENTCWIRNKSHEARPNQSKLVVSCNKPKGPKMPSGRKPFPVTCISFAAPQVFLGKHCRVTYSNIRNLQDVATSRYLWLIKQSEHRKCLRGLRELRGIFGVEERRQTSRVDSWYVEQWQLLTYLSLNLILSSNHIHNHLT